MATLASGIPVWTHLLTSDTGLVEHGQVARSATSDVFADCGSSPLVQHWQAHDMDYSSHYMIPPQAHMTTNPHLSTLQWANVPDGAHHTNLLQHCSEYQQQQQHQQQHQQLESAHHQDQHSHLLQQQQQIKSHVNHLADEDCREPKRPSPSLGVQDELANSEAFIKRPRLEQQPQQQQQAPAVPLKMQVRKEKLGERITALQQLVSPFGKTDTASVLLEAIGYIKFLQDQVQVLSTPYMKSNIGPSSMQHDDVSKMGWPSAKVKNDDARQDLRSRGLCLVPVSCTLQVANDNGADFWTPAIGGSCR